MFSLSAQTACLNWLNFLMEPMSTPWGEIGKTNLDIFKIPLVKRRAKIMIGYKARVNGGSNYS